jgi:hypothetical protein
MNKIIEFNLNIVDYDLDTIKQIEEQCKCGSTLNINDIELLLSYLSFKVRKKIAEFEGYDMEDYSYKYKCDLAQSMIYYYLKKLGVKVNPVCTHEIIKGVTGHSLVIVSFDTNEGEKTYLIDPTYIQFFSKEKCNTNNFVIINNIVCIAPDPGYFVVRSNKQDLILPLLRDGYIEFSEPVAKAYGDSFFQTKQGASLEQMKYNVSSGSSYIRWFRHYTSRLSKTEEELSNMGLLINPVCKIKAR